MVAKSKGQLETAVSDGIADNTAGAITPAVHRPILLDILDSVAVATPLLAGSTDLSARADWLTAAQLGALPEAFVVEGYLDEDGSTAYHLVPHQTVRKALLAEGNSVVLTMGRDDRIVLTVTAAGVVRAQADGELGTWHWWVRPAGPEATP